MFLSRLYYERSCRRARMPGGIHLRLLGHYEYVAVYLTYFLELRNGEVRKILFLRCWMNKDRVHDYSTMILRGHCSKSRSLSSSKGSPATLRASAKSTVLASLGT
jgi:hypothetical protein